MSSGRDALILSKVTQPEAASSQIGPRHTGDEPVDFSLCISLPLVWKFSLYLTAWWAVSAAPHDRFFLSFFFFFNFIKMSLTCNSTLAWKIPWMEKPGRLQSLGLRRVRHDWVTSLSLFTFMHWRRKWQPTPVFLPGESQGRRSLVGCRLWGRTESDMTEAI